MRLFDDLLDVTRGALLAAEGKPGRLHLLGRGFREAEIPLLDLGYYRDPETVGTSLRLRGHPTSALEEMRLLDAAWAGRLIGAWRDHRGVIGRFFGRDLHGEARRKYVSSGGLSRSQLMAYGLQVALHAGPELLLVEGYLDAAFLQRRGFPNAAALGTSGHAVKPALLGALAELGIRSLVVLMDDDQAGRDGSRTAAGNSAGWPDGLRVWIVPPEGLGGRDPDAVVRDLGAPALRAVLASRVSAADYLARTAA